MARETLKLSSNTNHYNTIIIGAGAAGLFCAAQLSELNKYVLILENSEKIGSKILISGGGRCNFTNLDVSHKNYLGQNPQFARSALSQFTNYDFIDMVSKHNIPYVEKTLGQLFVDKQGGAKDILNMLLGLVNAKIKTNVTITNVTKKDKFIIKTEDGEYFADNIIVASGGKSIPKMGATGLAYEIAERFDINIIPPAPALVPLVFSGDKYNWLKNLSGVSCDAIVKSDKISFKEALLFTHKGLSGPAILQISSYIQAGEEISIDFTAGNDFTGKLLDAKQKNANQTFISALSNLLPQRLAKELAGDLSDIKLQNVKNQQILDFIDNIQNFKIKPAGDEGYTKAEVTRGGIDTNELNQKTMESKKVKGLYFIGECVDITGWLGGFNFQWAWSSGYACGKAISQE